MKPWTKDDHEALRFIASVTGTDPFTGRRTADNFPVLASRALDEIERLRAANAKLLDVLEQGFCLDSFATTLRTAASFLHGRNYLYMTNWLRSKAEEIDAEIKEATEPEKSPPGA